MISKIQDRHRQKPAYVYIRQSTIAQVRHHQESTERQYALKNKALDLGWSPAAIRILDGDLGKSASRVSGRKDFKTLVADVSMGQVGALFALEASRLARSCLDWQRLLELCALTDTVVIDEDGCYDPADFNDSLLLGLKGTIAQAELHFIRVRLQGGKRNKAKKGQLRFPLPVGLCYDDRGGIVLDPDQQVQGAVRMVFSSFRKTGSAYGVAQTFAQQGLLFPKRSYGGVWDGNLIWGRLGHGRVLGILKNPSYAGTYVFGRYRSIKEISAEGEVHIRNRLMPMDEWLVTIKNHHESYISWEEYQKNQRALERNRANGQGTLLTGPAREGLALLQGLLVCSVCGHRLTVRYKGNGGLYPLYECNWRKREALSSTGCMSVRCDLLDTAVARRVLQVIEPKQIEMAYRAVKELEKSDKTVCRQWEMRIEKSRYEAQLAERRYLEVDPSNRLVAATLERRWNNAIVQLEEIKQQYSQFQSKQLNATTKEQKEKVFALAKDFPRLWHARTTNPKDKKRMLRLLIKDITVERPAGIWQAILHLRWQGGACEDIRVDLPMRIQDRIRYSDAFVERIRKLAKKLSDKQIVAILNHENQRSATGKPFSLSMLKWLRHKYKIPAYPQRQPGELTVKQVAEKFDISTNVVYYWISRGIITPRRVDGNSPYWIRINPDQERELLTRVKNSTRIQQQKLKAGSKTQL